MCTAPPGDPMVDPEPAEPSAPEPVSVRADDVRAARLRCEVCGRVTVHRILHWDRGRQASRVRREGVARCRECGATHPFEVRPVAETEFDLIVSRGAGSERLRVKRPSSDRLEVGQEFPDLDPPLSIRRIVRSSGVAVAEASVAEVASVWVVPALEVRLRVSVVEGARTRSAEWVVAPDTEISIGQEFDVEDGRVRVVALRAQGRTWRFADVRFPAREVQRVYGRRTERPPAGRRDWRRGRGTLRSRASVRSTSERSRSSPGVRRTRTSPSRRTAGGGAAVQRVSLS